MPAHERAARRRLFDALEAALGVRFEGREPEDVAELDAAVVLPGAARLAEALPASLPRLVALAEEEAPIRSSPDAPTPRPAGPRVELAGSGPLDARLRGARLHDAGLLPTDALVPEPGEAVVGSRDADPVWVATGRKVTQVERVALAPAELADDECLRDRVRDGRFLAVVALVHFLRRVQGERGWRAPPLRACFLFDDPNLHWSSYGHLRYPELVAHADRHGYHVALATVPLDGWFVHPRTARLFRARPDRLSLLVHGNNHTRLELARARGAVDRQALLAQAGRRVAALERRSGIPVARVMAPPHGVCSEQTAADLVPTGFEGLCVSRPFPWLARRGKPWLAKPAGASPLTGWGPASVVTGGLPVLLRRGFDDPVEDLALRAFLDQPLVIYGHHADVREGLDRLGELAARIARLGDVRWMSVRDILDSNFETMRHGDALRVRMFSRRVRVEIPPGVELVVGEFEPLDAPRGADVIESARVGGSAELQVVRRPAVDVDDVPAPPLPAWAIARRLLSEGRDRVAAQLQDRVSAVR
jgi:hypothetical protein